MRIAMQIFAAMLAVAGAVALKVGLGGDGGMRMFAIGAGVIFVLAGAAVFALAWKHPALVAAGEQRGETVMPLGKMVASFGALAAIWIVNLAILAVLIVLTIRLV
jgi:hypothetical protein